MSKDPHPLLLEEPENNLPWWEEELPGELAQRLEKSSITRLLRLQDELERMVHERYRKTLAVLFTDIAGSTAYFERHGDSAGRRKIQRHNDLLFPVVGRHGGRIVKTIGDAIMATFPSAQQAVDTAIEIQRILHQANAATRKQEEHIHVRIGVNYGTALVNEKDGDPFGDMVNVAARIQATAGEGQIYVSETVVRHVSGAVKTRPSGQFTLKGKTQPFQLYEVDWRSAEPEEPLVLPRLDPRYVVVKKLGAGGMAVVWRARDERLGRDVAIKVMHPHLANAVARERFEREARIAAGLGHEHIVQVFDFSTAEPFDPYIAMELVDGESLRAHTEQRGALPPGVVAAIGLQLIRALGYAHAHGVVHRDVKPENVFLSREGQVKLGDFGIAGVEDAVRQTTEGVLMGTPGYLAPEQLQGQPADARTDLYAFGVLLYELATGVQAFAGDSVASLMYRILENTYVRPETFPGMDKGLAAVINRCLAKDPAARFQSSEEVAPALKAVAKRYALDDLAAALRAYGATPPPPRGQLSTWSAAPTPPARRRSRRRWALGAAGVVLVLAAVAVGIGVKRWSRPAAPPVLPAQPVAAPTPKPEPQPLPQPPPQGTGKLQVIAHGGWLDVSVDGKPQGRTPLGAIEVSPGSHIVVVTNPFKRFKQRQTVLVSEGETTQLELDL